jgi:hypothetical protein
MGACGPSGACRVEGNGAWAVEGNGSRRGTGSRGFIAGLLLVVTSGGAGNPCGIVLARRGGGVGRVGATGVAERAFGAESGARHA